MNINDECPTHPGQQRILLCKTDNAILCILCVESHSKHDLAPILPTQFKTLKQKSEELLNGYKIFSDILNEYRDFCLDLRIKIAKYIDDEISKVKTIISEVTTASKLLDGIHKKYLDEKKKYDALKTKEADEKCINEISAKYRTLEEKCTSLLSENKNAIRGIRLQSMKEKIKRLKTSSGNYILHFLREGTNQICTYDLELNHSKTHTLTTPIPINSCA